MVLSRLDAGGRKRADPRRTYQPYGPGIHRVPEPSLSEYTGTVIFSSHDQDLIGKVANRVLELKPDGTYTDFKGSYAEFVDWTAAEAKKAKENAKSGKK